jgi:hypothetical protein
LHPVADIVLSNIQSTRSTSLDLSCQLCCVSKYDWLCSTLYREADLHEEFLDAVEGAPVGPTSVEVQMGRTIEVPKASGGWSDMHSTAADHNYKS